jgi:hypothetical protein
VNWTFDESLPAERQSEIFSWVKIKTYNGIDISEVFTTKKNVSLVPWMIIPSGVAQFTFDSGFTRTNGDTTVYYTVKDCSIQYNFEPGKKYYLMLDKELKTKATLLKFAEYTYYVRIYDYFPEFTNDRINKKQYRAYRKIVDSKNFDERLIASIPIFETDNLVKEQ